MQKTVKQAYRRELAAAASAERNGDYRLAFSHLERAHIVSQRYTLAHTATHFRMLRLAARRHDFREVLGQLPRAIAALVFSRIWVPVGNTGGTNASAFAPMPIPEDLAQVLVKS